MQLRCLLTNSRGRLLERRRYIELLLQSEVKDACDSCVLNIKASRRISLTPLKVNWQGKDSTVKTQFPKADVEKLIISV